MEDLDIRYLAGFVDGEGCINLHMDRSHPVIRLMIGNTNLEVLERIQKQYGGGSICKHNKPKNSNWKQVYRWVLVGKSATDLIQRLAPYLIIKKYQAQLVEQFVKDMPGERIKWDENVIAMYTKLFHAFNERGPNGKDDKV